VVGDIRTGGWRVLELAGNGGHRDRGGHVGRESIWFSMVT
jgi:hypothetical protein